MNDRRAEPRLMCSELIKVRLAGVRRAPLIANLEDVSASGACLQLEEPLPVGAALILLLRRRRFSATVKYCVHTEIGYLAGVQFDPGQKWSREDLTPRHLLDPAALRGRQTGSHR
jgi:PilZ domain